MIWGRRLSLAGVPFTEVFHNGVLHFIAELWLLSHSLHSSSLLSALVYFVSIPSVFPPLSGLFDGGLFWWFLGN